MGYSVAMPFLIQSGLYTRNSGYKRIRNYKGSNLFCRLEVFDREKQKGESFLPDIELGFQDKPCLVIRV